MDINKALLWKLTKDTYDVTKQHHSSLFAKTMTFQTLFCIIPAILTMVFLAGYFHFFNESISQLQGVSSQFLPHAIQDKLTPQLTSALANAQNAAIGSVTVFLAASFGLISNLLEIFYQFCDKKDPPSIMKQVLAYLLFVAFIVVYAVVGAILLYILSTKQFHIPESFLRIANFLMFTIIIYSFYYLLSPISLKKSRIFFVSLIISILVALIQKLFFLYLMWFPGYMLVYGTIAFIPLFFFWLYIFWTIFLYGYAFLIALHFYKNSENLPNYNV